ncbi:hypothetical protein BKA70DRAFT_1448955 [Coprinopsis sp. MPI-PUGE-AT-0042]|nr:hypothetical protein BKA70DRAFT_1448955 [Coprinopsis sp. MPI-PUGE-AT-0042]
MHSLFTLGVPTIGPPTPTGVADILHPTTFFSSSHRNGRNHQPPNYRPLQCTLPQRPRSRLATYWVVYLTVSRRPLWHSRSLSPPCAPVSSTSTLTSICGGSTSPHLTTHRVVHFNIPRHLFRAVLSTSTSTSTAQIATLPCIHSVAANHRLIIHPTSTRLPRRPVSPPSHAPVSSVSTSTAWDYHRLVYPFRDPPTTISDASTLWRQHFGWSTLMFPGSLAVRCSISMSPDTSASTTLSCTVAIAGQPPFPASSHFNHLNYH